MKNLTIFIVSFLAVSFISPVYATIYYVNGTTGNDAWDGLAAVWDGTHGPKKTIQAGINVSVNNDTVSVANGIYTGAGNKDLDFGGRAITVVSQNGPDMCKIDCQLSGRGFYFHSGEGATSVLDGFKIMNGSANNGGGIRCDSSSPTIRNCIISYCLASNNAGGIFCGLGSNPIITDCVINDNYSSQVGGGICILGGSNPAFTRCTVTGNSTGQFAAGFYWFNSSPTLNNCSIIDNDDVGIFSYLSTAEIINCRIAGNSGRGVDFFHDNATITNCTIGGNSSWEGAGILCIDSDVNITNCTISGNTLTEGGDVGGISIGSTCNINITNCIIWGNDGNEINVYPGGVLIVKYSDVEGGCFGVGNINKDPMLLPLAGGTLRLKHGSPCIDAGTSAAPAPATDMDGRSRWDDPNTPNTGGGATAYYDMGAHEFKGWHVNGNPAIGNDAYNGAYPTWVGGVNGPERTIQAGINDAADGDVVTVAPYTYSGTGNVELNFANGLPAGQTRLITLTSSAGAETTIIDCQNANRGFHFVVYEDNTATVHGFTIINGYSSSYGAGIRFLKSSPTISECVLMFNEAGTDGGGIDCWQASPVITNCTISKNIAGNGYGGGINCNDSESNPKIINCRITNNISDSGYGGGISCYYSSPRIINNLITNNRSKLDGGGVWCYRSNPIITNCTFSLNDSRGCGSGIACEYSNPIITNCILCDNVSDEICVISGSPIVTYSDVKGGTGQPWFGTGCIDKDPLFVSGPLHNFYLSQIAAGQTLDSKCVNAGSAPADELGMHNLSTRTDGGKDVDTVDMGYHALHSLYIYNITRSGNDITIYWKNTPGASYTVQWSSNMTVWTDVPVGITDHWTDVGGGLVSERYYRVKE